jgi:hypothetical protein
MVVNGYHISNSADEKALYAGGKRTDLYYSEFRVVYRSILKDKQPHILKAGYGQTRLASSSAGILTIYCDVDLNESTQLPVEVELCYEGIPAGLFLNDDGIDGDETAGDNRYSLSLNIPPLGFEGSLLFELIVRDATGKVSDRWPKFWVN